jgi:hypothetical protein
MNAKANKWIFYNKVIFLNHEWLCQTLSNFAETVSKTLFLKIFFMLGSFSLSQMSQIFIPMEQHALHSSE